MISRLWLAPGGGSDKHRQRCARTGGIVKYNPAEATKLGVAIEDPLVIADPDAFAWDETADLVVVGLGGAGVAAALEGLERGLKVIALDHYDGGGSSAANGGIYYAG